jgi:hypothetical protein
LCLPADKKILCDFFFTFVADVHIAQNTSNAEGLSRYFQGYPRGIIALV